MQLTGGINFDIALISSENHFYDRMKWLEAQGVPRDRIIDGRVFRIPNFDFPRFLIEGVAYGSLNKNMLLENGCSFYTIYPRVYAAPDDSVSLSIGTKSYIAGVHIEGEGEISVGKFCSISWTETFELALTGAHNPKNVGTYDRSHLDSIIPKEFIPPVEGTCKIKIGSDVWIGRGCFLKANNPDKPLIIGDGAVIAANSVVVKSVPPYAIVGGNPARIIKYRFSEDIIESLLRIRWWDWDIDKIYENFKYFNRVEEFVAIHDK